MKEKVHKILIDINENQLKKCKLAKITIDTLEKNILTKIIIKSDCEQDLEKIIIDYLTEVFLKNVLKEPNSKLYSTLIKPYLAIYTEVNKKYKIKETTLNQTNFFELVILNTLKHNNKKEIITSDYIKSLSIKKTEKYPLKRKKAPRDLFSKFPEEQKEDIIKVIHGLKNTYPNYYKIFIKRHGESLEEWHVLHGEDLKLYSNAFSILTRELLKLKKSLFKNLVIIQKKK